MSARETAVDVLIGSALVLILASLFAIGFGAIGLVIYSLELGLKHFFPGLVRAWDIEFCVFLSLWSLASGIGHLRKRRFLNAFMSLAVIPMITFVWLAEPHSRPRFSVSFVWSSLLLLLSSGESVLTRLEFMLGAFAIGMSVALDAGLCGTGAAAKVAADSVVAAMIPLLAIYFRREQRRFSSRGAAALTGA